MESLAILFYLCAVIAAAIGTYEYSMFYHAWRHQRLQVLGGRFTRDHWLFREYRLALDARLAMFSGGLSEECRRHRRRVLWALVAFFACSVLGSIALYSVYGPHPGSRGI